MAEKIHKFVLAMQLIRSVPQTQSAIQHFEEQKKQQAKKCLSNCDLIPLLSFSRWVYKPTPALIETVIILT